MATLEAAFLREEEYEWTPFYLSIKEEMEENDDDRLSYLIKSIPAPCLKIQQKR